MMYCGLVYCVKLRHNLDSYQETKFTEGGHYSPVNNVLGGHYSPENSVRGTSFTGE